MNRRSDASASEPQLIFIDMRTITAGPVPLAARGDRHEWRWTLASGPGEQECVDFAVTGTAGGCGIEGLPTRVQRAIVTEGRSEIERILGEAETPMRIEAGTEWVTIHNRDRTWSRAW
jgi:hypothetical protein